MYDQTVAFERIEALAKLVNQLHDKLEKPVENIAELLSYTATAVGLLIAFQDEMDQYFDYCRTDTLSLQTVVLMFRMNTALNCISNTLRRQEKKFPGANISAAILNGKTSHKEESWN